TQTLSFRSTDTDVTSPSAQSFGIVGQLGSTSNAGAGAADWAWASWPTHIAKVSIVAAQARSGEGEMFMARDDTTASLANVVSLFRGVSAGAFLERFSF